MAGGHRIGRGETLTMISAIMALMALGIDMMLPAFDDIRDAYDLADGSSQVGQVITVFFMGMALGQLAFGPLADRFGRQPILYVSMTIYVLSAVASVLAPSYGTLLTARFVWGIGAAGSRVVATAIVRDRFSGIEMAKAMSQIMAVFVLVPIIAPTLGAGVIAILPWRAIFWCCAVWAVGIGFWSLRLGETLDPANRRTLDVATTLGGYRTVARTRVTMGFTVATIFLQGVFTGYLASSEAMIGDVFGREDEFPMVFGAVAVVFGIGALVNGRAVGRFGIDRTVSGILMAQAPICVALVVVTLGADGRPAFWVYMPLLALLLGTFMFLMPNLNAAAMEPVGALAGTASAFTGSLRMAAGAVLGTIVSGEVTDSVSQFTVGAAALVAASAVTITIVRKRAARMAPVPAG